MNEEDDETGMRQKCSWREWRLGRFVNLTTFILVALVAGVVIGAIVNATVESEESRRAVAEGLDLLTTVFLRMIKMLIAPLVFSLLTVAVAGVGGGAEIGRIGVKAVAWFFCASLCSLLLGMLLVNIFQPGVALREVAAGLISPHTNSSASSSPQLDDQQISISGVITHALPTSIFDALARNEVLQILVFSIFFGLAAGAVGPPAQPLIGGLEALSLVMLTVTRYVMRFAPLGVFGAVCATVTLNGTSVLGSFLVFVIEFYLGILLLWLLLLLAGFAAVRARVFRLFAMVAEPCLLAFTTASSEAAYPKTLLQLTRFGVHPRVASFVLPLGYSFNLDGSMMYCTFAVIFIAQAFSIELTVTQQLTMLLILMLTSKGMAGVPRASLLVIQATLAHFHIPEVGLLLLLGIDHFLDMARSATNVIGNSIAAVMVAKWEGQLAEEGAWDEGEEIEGDLEHEHLDDGDGSIEASIDDGDPRKELLCSREDLE